MAYSAPADFADGDVLSATQLNVLSTNQEYFKGVVDAPNVVFAALHLDGTNIDKNYFFEHTHRYIHWSAYLNSAIVSRFSIEIYSVDGILQYGAPIYVDVSTPSDNAAAQTAGWTGSFDAVQLTPGTTYRAFVDFNAGDGSADAYLLYLEERSTA